MSGALFGAALACFAVGVAVDLLFGVTSRVVRPVPYLLGLAGSVCLVVVGVHAVTTRGASVNLTHLFNVGHGALRIDQLAGFFLTLLFGIAAAP
jgi:hypothetical protein